MINTCTIIAPLFTRNSHTIISIKSHWCHNYEIIYLLFLSLVEDSFMNTLEHSYTWKFMPVLTRMILSTHIDIGDPMKY